ncbi:MAG: hypothetical protein HOP19_23280 [Acidobacteria bacterium]|nr:hypothetical protein [Acidobacteriota bacterium]
MNRNGTTCQSARVVRQRPRAQSLRAVAVDSAFMGQTHDVATIKAATAQAEADASDAMEDIHASGEYRRNVARVYAGHALQAAANAFKSYDS